MVWCGGDTHNNDNNKHTQPPCHTPPSPTQLRRRDAETKKVLIEERRYDNADGEDALSSLEEEAIAAFDGNTTTLFNATSAFGGSLDENDMYAWAQRLRDIPNKDALSQLAMGGYTSDGSIGGGRGKVTFVNGTGIGRRSKRRSANNARRG